jgi:hypothetical protein
MRLVAETLPLARLEAILSANETSAHPSIARGLLFGAAGFLPASPSDANAAGWTPAETNAAEAAWTRYGGAWSGATLPPTAWTRARVRPANHPARRLEAGAAILAGAMRQGGLLHVLLEGVRSGATLSELLRELAGSGSTQPLGAGRAWESLPAAEPNEITRRAMRQVAGDARLPGLGARGQQGLIHLDQTLCAPRRCFQCPIGHAATSSEQ